MGHNEETKEVVVDRAHENNQLTYPKTKKDILRAMPLERTNIIPYELRNNFNIYYLTSTCNISIKENIVVPLHYVDKCGYTVECFLGCISHTFPFT